MGNQKKPAIIVHGGAWDIPTEVVEDHRRGCKLAVEAGWQVLSSGGCALDAVQIAVQTMEDDPCFDAGRGSFLNKIGQVELDASIMDGKTLEAGAVAAIQNMKNPVCLAREILAHSEHVLLTGSGALHFAESVGIETCSTEELLVGRERQRYRRLHKNKTFRTRQVFEPETPHGTVGAVAIDGNGDLAAATSTGGTPKKLPGRVGDSPIIGAGTYADNAVGAASCTGWGESIMKVLLAKTACDLLASSSSARQAATAAIEILKQKVGGLGGLILISSTGDIGFAFNTPKMACAYKSSNTDMKCHV